MTRRAAAAAVVVVLGALGLPPLAGAARYHVGLERDADPHAVERGLAAAAGSSPESLAPLRALAIEASSADVLRRVPGVAWVERARHRRASFAPNDVLAARQWYATATRTLDAWQARPPLAPVLVGVIDSGVDLAHPDLQPRVEAAKSFVGGTAQDVRGHGTIVAGVIAAELDNQIGIAGLAPSARLLVAKVVGPGGSIPVEAEAKAIRWAVDRGARVLNMSLGGVRDPSAPELDTYSRLEAEAVAYAVRKGVVVVAAVGNGDQAPQMPWRFASYPAALPHVVGVSALARNGASPGFSNRDAVYNDLAAPGEDILSTFPRSLTGERPQCPDQGYTPCATEEFRPADGTSFAAPQATAVAANLLGARPGLQAAQVAAIVERTAVDATAGTGCSQCPLGRDALTGWGRLDGAAAIAALGGPLPPRDGLEPNDDAGGSAYRLYFPAGATARFVRASLDFWDDQDDVYAVRLRRGERLFASLVVSSPADVVLALWRPGTASVGSLLSQGRRLRLSNRTGRAERLSWTAAQPGWHYLQARLTAPGGPIAYRLSVVRAR